VLSTGRQCHFPVTLCLDAQNLAMELNCTEIPNLRWKGNDLHFNSAVCVYMIFVVGIKRKHRILIRVWMCKVRNRIGEAGRGQEEVAGQGKATYRRRSQPTATRRRPPLPAARCSATRPGRGHRRCSPTRPGRGHRPPPPPTTAPLSARERPPMARRRSPSCHCCSRVRGAG
jgi:hypothetical protein